MRRLKFIYPKIFKAPLDEKGVLSIFFIATMSGAERLMGSARRAPVVSGVLVVSNLLCGGFGYEDF
ncbi:hypothetical protein [Afipia felis]|uniref:Uncharacterized protein n=2 Tax=Afipia felis TaxID=1035 RepID=A0A380WDB2_AFIFE|nr:hypothetical protein [Afipia felis]EKS29887.1 hypothetical protein HMPREF9697_02415 [Afipia felis ATCC 53690]SUU78594.1 Uncharacterised protein [Afipia felis]SUU86659.1 Uncharacterised protein [Afipia felis]